MIFDSENVLKEGTEFKFEAAPVDPNAPFRGKYITLRYKETTTQVSENKNWKNNETIYVSLINDENGFAKIYSVSKEEPIGDHNFVKAKVGYYYSNQLTIEYPFNRFYMEESKAYDAEVIYNKSLRDRKNHNTYALIYVKDGEAVINDVLIDGISIKEIVKSNNK
jgi:uncharacterized membrane-anchored protein